MIVQLIGFAYNLPARTRRCIVRDVINSSSANLILFPGHTLQDKNDVAYLKRSLVKRDLVAIFELEEGEPSSVMPTRNELMMYRDGKIEDLYTSQLFSTNDDLKGKPRLMEKFFDESPRRQFELLGKRITIIQCGENSFLVGSRENNLEAEFRFKDDPALVDRFNKMLKETDIFLNPIHPVQGEQGVMSRRRKFLSSDGRYYFSTCFLGENNKNLLIKSLQYAWYDGKELAIEPDKLVENRYVSRTIEIE